MVIFDDTQTVSNVNGVGTYSTSGDIMTLDGTFFEFESGGVDLSAMNGEQSANFSIDGNRLTFMQDEEETTTVQGITSTSRLISTSVWVKQ